ncbi:MAG: ABC transporter substrate-binding protein [Candidatus Methanomethylophilaceae archaeon]
MEMNAIKIKVTISISIILAVCVITPLIGITEPTRDEKEGVMIDFGYYNVTWVPLELNDDMNGMDALISACGIEGYEIGTDAYGNIVSIDGEANLVASSWSMYVLRGNDVDVQWSKVEDPYSFRLGDERIISWARASAPENMMPAVDSLGHTYYSYAESGKNFTGSDLRVVSMAPSVTETIVAVGGEDLIVATDCYSNYPSTISDAQDAGEIELVGGYTDPNFELIVSVSPDIVFLDGSVGEHVTMADKLRKSGISAVVLYEVVEVSDLLKNIWIASSALGMSENGNTYIKNLSKTIESICAVTNIVSDKVFIALSASESPYVAGSDTYADTILRSIGATNVFSNIQSWGMVDKEAVYVKQPDAIIIIYQNGKVETDAEYNELLQSLNRMWKDTPAFQNKRIFVFSGMSADLISRPGARLGAAVELIAKVLDPDSFIKADYWDRSPKYFADDYATYLKYQGAEGVLLV